MDSAYPPPPACPQELLPELQRVQQQASKLYPSLNQPGSEKFASDVESEASHYYVEVWMDTIRGGRTGLDTPMLYNRTAVLLY